MPKTNVSKSISIAASKEKVHSIVTDFNQWKEWSPWLILEPEAKVNVIPEKKYYEWEGKRIGSGSMQIASDDGSEIVYKLIFLTPFKSKADVKFILESEGEKTKATWTMDSSLPFFLFFMKKMMERLIGMDYERGLYMLKDYVEKGRVESKIEFKGTSQLDGISYVGINNTCTIDDLGKVMEADFKKIREFAQNNSSLMTDKWFSIYHKFDFKKNRVVYTSAVGINSSIEKLPSGMITGHVPTTKVYTVRHTGPYELSGNPWNAVMMMERAKEIKNNKKIQPMEFYLNSPMEVEPKDLITEVSMPVL